MAMLAGCATAPGAAPLPPQIVYQLKGELSLLPQSISDDGLKTYLLFKPQQPLPAIFARDEHGAEQLVNGGIRGERYVVDAVAERWVFRLGAAVATAERRHTRPASRRATRQPSVVQP